LERCQRTSSTIPARIRISPSAIQRQELLTRLGLALALAGSAGSRVCTCLEADGRGKLVLSSGKSGVAVGLSVGNAVAVAGLGVGSTVAEDCVRGGVWLPAVGWGVGVKEAVAGLVAVAVPKVDSTVGVDDGSELVGYGVSEGTPGGSVGALVGGGAVSLAAVGVLVAPVGVIVGIV
jgi:hypothetical protein